VASSMLYRNYANSDHWRGREPVCDRNHCRDLVETYHPGWLYQYDLNAILREMLEATRALVTGTGA